MEKQKSQIIMTDTSEQWNFAVKFRQKKSRAVLSDNFLLQEVVKNEQVYDYYYYYDYKKRRYNDNHTLKNFNEYTHTQSHIQVHTTSKNIQSRRRKNTLTHSWMSVKSCILEKKKQKWWTSNDE